MISINVTHGTVTLSLASRLHQFEARKHQIYREIGTSLLVSIRQGFERERTPDGDTWEPLKKATVRQRKGNAHPILQQKGQLKKSITYKVTSESVVVGTNLAYAAIHQYGGTMTRAAGATKLHFRRIGRGAKKGQVRFTRANDRRVKFGMATAAHSIRIPARPYLFQRDGGIPEAWSQALVNIVKNHLGIDHAESD